MFSMRDSNSSILSSYEDQSFDSSDDIGDIYEEEEEDLDQIDKNFIVLTHEEILKEQDSQIQRISELFDVPSSIAKQLLSQMRWKVDVLIEKYYGGESDSLYEKGGIANPDHPNFHKRQVESSKFTCTICYCEYESLSSYQLVCGHPFCTGCWNYYLTHQITSLHNGQRITCPAKGCNILVDEDTVLSLIDKEVTKTRYKRLLDEAYVSDNSNMRWCPGKDCDKVVRVKLLREKEIKCECGTTFCFTCGNEHHAPADCDMAKKWEQKCVEEGKLSEWMVSYTKECPFCKCLIQKDGGCQYVVCSKCRASFCWICLGAFNHKNHACNQYKENNSLDKDRKELHKFTHFYLRYKTHQESLRLEDRLHIKAQKMMEHLLQVQKLTWISVQYIKEAAEVLTKTRTMLKWSYVYGYYLPHHINRYLFEFLQANLESVTEKLSQLLESKEPPERQKIVNATVTVSKEVKKLIEGLAEGEIVGGDKSERFYSGSSMQKYEGWIYNQNS